MRDEDLAGQLLIAMPGMADPRFQRSVILICAHSGRWRHGPDHQQAGAAICRSMGCWSSWASRPPRVAATSTCASAARSNAGAALCCIPTTGPAERPRCEVPGGLKMTATLDILEALAGGNGPAQALLALGYSGWGPGQLEDEIGRNDWLVWPIRARDLVFSDEDPGEMGRRAGG